MTADQSIIALCCAALGIIFVAGLLWHGYRSDAVLREWGRANGFEILSQEECWKLSRETLGKSVYRLTVRDSAGRRRSGTALRGLSLLTDDINVRWDD